MSFRRAWIAVILICYSLIFSGCQTGSTNTGEESVPNLPSPIATERALITSAGQGIEGIILASFTNQLNIKNYYRPKAEVIDLEDVNSLIIALGFSPKGLKSNNTDPTNEINRIKTLATIAKKEDKAVILVHLGGFKRRDSNNDNLVQVIKDKLDYIIVTKDSNRDGFFSKIAIDNKIPYTEVKAQEGIKVPLNSAFR